VFLADSSRNPYGKLEPLATLRTNPDGTGIVQAIAPLKTLATDGENASSQRSRRFIIIAEMNAPTHVVLRQVR